MAVALWASAARADGVATVLSGGSIFTAREAAPAGPDATWMVVRDGRVIDVGAGELPRRWSASPRVDLAGRFVLPGLVAPQTSLVLEGLRRIAPGRAPRASALFASADALPPQGIAQALLEAQAQALAAGVTAVGDDTQLPIHFAQMVRLADAGLLVLRVSSRSQAGATGSRQTMRALADRKSCEGRLVYLGDEYALDAPGGPPSQQELEEVLLFAGPVGLSFRADGLAAVTRLLAAREAVGQRRRAGAMPDEVLGCAACDGELALRLRASGLRVLLREGASRGAPVLRDLAAGGGEPVLAQRPEAGEEASSGPAPLRAATEAIAGGAGVSESLLAITRNAAIAIGRPDLGVLTPGAPADFTVLDKSPFDLPRGELRGLAVVQTWIAGERVHDAAGPPPARLAASSAELATRFSAAPGGWAAAPLFGYDPTPGFVLGAALFAYPYGQRGYEGSLAFLFSPGQGRMSVDAKAAARDVLPGLTARASAELNTYQGNYYGAGMQTPATAPVRTDPAKVEALVGLEHPLPDQIRLGLYAHFAWLRERAAAQIAQLAPPGVEGVIEGAYAGGRLDLSHDTRDNQYSTLRGGVERIYLEQWIVQGGQQLPRARVRADASRFLTLRAPDWVLALHAEAGFTVGNHAYLTNFGVGGSGLVRGYLSDRFRGHSYAAAAAELRFPLLAPVSGAAFAETGRVWLDSGSNAGGLGYSAGGGLRVGLPPDGLVKVRLDVAKSPDQLGTYVTFGEAF